MPGALSRRRTNVSAELSLPASKHFVVHGMLLFGFELFSLRTQAVDLIEHPLEKGFRRGCGNPGPLKLEDLLALSPYLGAHAFDF
jgi:hypothetical protein